MELIEIYIMAIVILLILSAIFACSETMITAISRAKVSRLAQEGDKSAKNLEKLLKKREKVISSMLIGNNMVNILSSVLATSVFLKIFGEAGLIYATISMTILVIIFAEIAPKTIALKITDKVARALSPTITVFVAILSPLATSSQKIVNIVIAVFISNAHQASKEEEIKEIRDTVRLKHKEGSIVEYDKDLIDGVLDLSDIEIGEIMVHRKEITGINIDLEIEEIIKLSLQSKYTRIPLWRDNEDNIIAILNVRRLLKAIQKNKGITKNINFLEATSRPWFVPVSNTLREQLVSFRKRRKRFALVIDEYGSLLGLITLEDILEEIVGEMNDHEDGVKLHLVKSKSGSYKIPGKTLIRDLNKTLKWDLPEDEDAYNITAYIINNLGRVPDEKETFEIANFKFSILKRRGSDLVLVKIRKIINQ
ncbi:MAG: DUF21 domain-containing protein [Rickettsiales bacterium]|nr:DUF21 domain-containing protein [Rickettsiales bacterium]